MRKIITASILQRAVRNLNFELGIGKPATGEFARKGEYIVAKEYFAARGRYGWTLYRECAGGMEPIGARGCNAGAVYDRIEAMLDGIAAARGESVPRCFYSKFIKRDQPAAADHCATCDTIHPAPADCCPVTGEEYGTGA